MSQFQDRIVQLVEQHWQSTNAVMLASALGTALSKEFDLRAELGRLKLLTYIEHNLSERVRIIASTDDKRRGLLPAATSMPTTLNELERLFPTKVEMPIGPSYEPAVWQAFAYPIEEGQTRYLIIGTDISRVDLPEGAASPDQSVEISKTLIIPPHNGNPLERIKSIHANILAWAKTNGIVISQLTIKRGQDREPRSSLLDRLMENLSDSELSSITLNLHVVKRLRGTLIK